MTMYNKFKKNTITSESKNISKKKFNYLKIWMRMRKKFNKLIRI